MYTTIDRRSNTAVVLVFGVGRYQAGGGPRAPRRVLLVLVELPLRETDIEGQLFFLRHCSNSILDKKVPSLSSFRGTYFVPLPRRRRRPKNRTRLVEPLKHMGRKGESGFVYFVLFFLTAHGRWRRIRLQGSGVGGGMRSGRAVYQGLLLVLGVPCTRESPREPRVNVLN